MSRHSSYITSVPTRCSLFSFFFHDTATTEIYTLSLHDALPILRLGVEPAFDHDARAIIVTVQPLAAMPGERDERSEEHTSELQSHSDLVCRLLLEKKKNEI